MSRISEAECRVRAADAAIRRHVELGDLREVFTSEHRRWLEDLHFLTAQARAEYAEYAAAKEAAKVPQQLEVG